MHKIRLAVVLIFGIYLSSSAQELKPIGIFQLDSAELGEIIPFSLTFQYPRNLKVVFPDSIYDFSPFEFNSKSAFQTISDSTNSKDSVVYYLRSFEIDPLLPLSLPVFLVSGRDSSSIFSDSDTVIFKEMITVMPDSIALIENTALVQVSQQFNYPYLLTGLVVFIICSILVFLVFGKTIRTKFKLYRIKKAYKKFLLGFEQRVNKLQLQHNNSKVESLLLFWKSYMEKIKKIPFKKLTTKEIISLTDHSEMHKTLQEIDKAIYGSQFEYDINLVVSKLKEYATEAYETEVKKIKNG